jgi:uncharacterized YkwD family protein
MFFTDISFYISLRISHDKEVLNENPGRKYHLKKHGKLIAVSAVMLLGLAACNNNNNEALDLRDNRMTTLGDRDADYWDNKQGTRTYMNSGKKQARTGEAGTSEILQMSDGYLTIDPNSYSTGIPSSRYPHTEMNRQGRLTYQDRQRAQQPDSAEQTPPQTDLTEPAPAQIPEQGAAPSPEGGTAPAPEQGTTPAPNEGTAPEQGAAPKETPSGTALSAYESRVIDLTNEQRRKNGLPNLQPDTALSNVAQEKSNDMQAKNYFSHTSPTYGSPFDMMRDFGVTYRSAGENIAMGQQSAEEVVNAWMNSEGHRKNILSPNYTHIGVGHTGSGNYWTQMFIGK